MSLDAADAFVWESGSTLLMRRSVPATVGAIYLAAVFAHNARLRRLGKPSASARKESSSPWLDAAAVVHNALLVAFSAVVFVVSTFHASAQIRASGLHRFICPEPAPPAGGSVFGAWWPAASSSAAAPPPLSGPLHFWCYVFYASKYYELLDTAILAARRKRVIFLHAVHHALIPYVMWLCFDGRVSVSLVGLATLNSLVHVVMYAYYLAVALGAEPPLGWKKQITRLQIAQFGVGTAGGLYYWRHHLRGPRLELGGGLPRIGYDGGCAGGDSTTVFAGFCMNLLLLCLFVRFYRRAYGGPKALLRARSK